MCNNIFQEIDSLHSEWSMMDKANRLSWLAGKKIRLSLLATQFTQYVYIRGGFFNDIERNFACKLPEMIQAVDIHT